MSEDYNKKFTETVKLLTNADFPKHLLDKYFVPDETTNLIELEGAIRLAINELDMGGDFITNNRLADDLLNELGINNTDRVDPFEYALDPHKPYAKKARKKVEEATIEIPEFGKE